jgi:hypothetical protein
LEYTLYHIKLASGHMVDIGYAMPIVQKQWEAEARPPLLTRSPSDYEGGWNCLQDLGVPKNAWFVCLHVREDGFRREGITTHRSADINTYSLAIESIVARGGWVIRMGDPTMKPLPPMKQAIDYARTDAKAIGWMFFFALPVVSFWEALRVSPVFPWYLAFPALLPTLGQSPGVLRRIRIYSSPNLLGQNLKIAISLLKKH